MNSALPFDHPLFAHRSPQSVESNGCLEILMYVKSEAASYFAVFEAQDVAKGLTAKVKTPQRVPYGFHDIRQPEV